MSISLISNFSINLNAPIDDRIIATNSAARNSIQYLYDGLTVFQTDTRQSWTWNASAATWSYNVSGNGIYAGSGSVVGNTYVNLNSISTGAAANTTSNLLGYYSNLSSSSNVYYLNTFASKQSGSLTSPLSFVIQNLSNSTNYSYIQFNPDNTDIGALAFGYNTTEYLRLASNGNLILKVGNLILQSPTYSATIYTNLLSSSNNYYLPNKSGTFAMLGDTTLQSVLLNSNTATASIIIGNTTKLTLNATSSIFTNSGNLASSLDSNGILKLSDTTTNYVANIQASSGFTANFTYSIPSGGGTFQMRKKVIYQKTFNSGIQSTAFFTTDSNSGRFIITRIIYMTLTQPSPLPGFGTQPSINIGFTSPNYTDIVSAYSGATTPNLPIFLQTSSIGSTLLSLNSSTQVWINQTNSGNYVRTYSIYVEGFYVSL